MSRRKETTPRLTKARIDALTYPYDKASGRSFYVADHAVERLYVRVLPSGRRRFVVRAYIGDQKKEIVLGDYGPITLDEARTAALATLARVDRGETRGAAARAGGTPSPTFGEFVARYLSDHAVHKASGAEQERLIRRHLLPRWRDRRLDTITTDDVLLLRKAMERTPYEANRTRDLVMTLFNRAVRWDVLPHDHKNPAKAVERFREAPRSRVLTPDEVQRLIRAISEFANPSASAFFTVLIHVPFRRGELMRARWDGYDAPTQTLRIVDTASNKRSSPQAVPATVATVLEAVPRVVGNPYIFTSRDGTTHVREVDSAWQSIRANAGVPDARMHDLRRTIATEYAASGASEFRVQQLLGHVTTQAARHYVHLATTQDVARDFLAARAERLRPAETPEA